LHQHLEPRGRQRDLSGLEVPILRFRTGKPWRRVHLEGVLDMANHTDNPYLGDRDTPMGFTESKHGGRTTELEERDQPLEAPQDNERALISIATKS
jgi:hypothetical protein